MKVYVEELPRCCEKCEFYECQADTIGEWGIKKTAFRAMFEGDELALNFAGACVKEKEIEK